MQIAVINADYGVSRFGGKRSDYFAEALRLAHAGVNLSIDDSKDRAISFCYVGMFTVIAIAVLIYGVVCGYTVNLITSTFELSLFVSQLGLVCAFGYYLIDYLIDEINEK